MIDAGYDFLCFVLLSLYDYQIRNSLILSSLMRDAPWLR